MGSKRKIGANAQTGKRSGMGRKEQDRTPVMVKTKHVNVPFERKKMKTVTRSRRSQRIMNLVRPAENQNKKVNVYELEDSGSETEVELGVKEKSAEPVTEPPGLANGNGRNGKRGRPRKIKKTHEVVNMPRGLNDGVAAGRTIEEQRGNDTEKTQEVVNMPRGLNDGVAAGRTVEEQRVNNAEKTQEVVNMPLGLNDGVTARTEVAHQDNNADENQEAAIKSVERSSSKNISDQGSRYKTLYIKAMKRLDAVTEERNVLSRQLAVAQAKIGVLHDFRDQLSEVTEKLDVANERLEVYQKTMSPQMVDMLRDFLTTTTQSQTAEVPQNTSSEKGAGMDKATKPCTRRSSKKRKHN